MTLYFEWVGTLNYLSVDTFRFQALSQEGQVYCEFYSRTANGKRKGIVPSFLNDPVNLTHRVNMVS
jgi:hypothetical protein